MSVRRPDTAYHLVFSAIKNFCRHIAEWAIIIYHPILAVAIEINSLCNRRCPHCPNHYYTRETGYLDEETVHKIIDELKRLNFVGRLTFSIYNEPLLDRRLVKFIRYARRNLPQCYIYLNTNGDFLDLSAWKSLREAGLDYALVSVYDSKIRYNITGPLDRLDPEEKKRLSIRIFDVDRDACNRAGLVPLNNRRRLPLKEFCVRPFYQVNINYLGKIILCCNDFLGLVEMGDIRKQTIKDVWNCRKYNYYRIKLLFRDRAHLDLCNRCDFVEKRIVKYPLQKPVGLLKFVG